MGDKAIRPVIPTKEELERLIHSTKEELAGLNQDGEQFLKTKKALIDYEIKMKQLYGVPDTDNLSPFLPPRKKLPEVIPEGEQDFVLNPMDRTASLSSRKRLSRSNSLSQEQQATTKSPSQTPTRIPLQGQALFPPSLVLDHQHSPRVFGNSNQSELSPSVVEDRLRRIQSILDEKNKMSKNLP